MVPHNLKFGFLMKALFDKTTQAFIFAGAFFTQQLPGGSRSLLLRMLLRRFIDCSETNNFKYDWKIGSENWKCENKRRKDERK
jgi:hypothetical protein